VTKKEQTKGTEKTINKGTYMGVVGVFDKKSDLCITTLL